MNLFKFISSLEQLLKAKVKQIIVFKFCLTGTTSWMIQSVVALQPTHLQFKNALVFEGG